MNEADQGPWLLGLLRCIRSRPGMYLGHEDVRSLEQYVVGYCQARADLGRSVWGSEPDHLRLFSAWLQRRQGLENSSLGWRHLVEKQDPSDRNIFTFYALFEAYLAEAGVDFEAVTPWNFARWT